MSRTTIHLSSRPHDYDRDFPTFRKPAILGDFSLDSERGFHHDRRQMMYLHRRDARDTMDLNHGIEHVVRKNEEVTKKEELDNLLHWILNNRDKFLATGQETLTSLNSSVVCYRGLLTTMMCTPYDWREDWQIKIIKWRGTMYICQVETDQRRAQRLKRTPRQKTMSSWGYKFEQYMTTSDPADLPNLNTPVIESEEFCCVFRSRLNQFSLVYGAEMDGYESDSIVEPRQLLKPEKFVEMKTSRIIENDRQHRTFSRYKILKWWGQSFLVGIEEIICGWRDDDGFVRDVESFKIRQLPKSAAEWKPNVCANFLAELLTAVSEKVVKDDLNVVYNVSWMPREGLSLWRGGEGENFLPKWYTSQVFM